MKKKSKTYVSSKNSVYQLFPKYPALWNSDTELLFLITSVIVEALGFAFRFIKFDMGSQKS